MLSGLGYWEIVKLSKDSLEKRAEEIPQLDRPEVAVLTLKQEGEDAKTSFQKHLPLVKAQGAGAQPGGFQVRGRVLLCFWSCKRCATPSACFLVPRSSKVQG